MNLLDLQNRLRELNSQKFLSDDETEEKEQILEEIAILRKNQREPKKIENKLVKVVLPQKQQREHTVIGKALSNGLKAIVEHFKEKPVTLEELQQLKLQSVKYKLKADIAKSKATIRKSKGDIFNIAGSGPKKRSYTRSSPSIEENVGNMLRGATRTRNPNLWSKSSSNDIRKTFYG